MFHLIPAPSTPSPATQSHPVAAPSIPKIAPKVVLPTPREQVRKLIEENPLYALKMAGLFYTLAPLALLNIVPIAALSLRKTLRYRANLPLKEPGLPTQNNGWSPHIEVIAACSQKTGTTDYYMRELLEALTRPDVHTLNEAHGAVMQNGYPAGSWILFPGIQMPPYITVYPPAPARELAGFDKRETGKKRYILAFSNGALNISTQLSTLPALKALYTIPDEQIQHLKDPSIAEVERTLKALSDKIQTETPKSTAPESTSNKESDIEVLITFNAHGDATAPPNNNDQGEGSYQGSITLGKGWKGETLTEEKLKAILNPLFKNANVFLLMNTCRAGAWIA